MKALLLLLCTAQLQFTQPVTIGFQRTQNAVFFRATVNDQSLWFVLDSGAARTLLDARIAQRLGIRGTEQSSIGGAGAGRIPVSVASHGTMSIGALRLSEIRFHLMDLEPLTGLFNRKIDGIIGNDLLCDSIVTIDYAAERVNIAPPNTNMIVPRSASVLPLTFRSGWSFVDATIKVAGNAAVTDSFLVDSGSQDAADHPIIRKSKGELRTTRSGNGIGDPTAGVVGPAEWLHIGRFTIAHPMSSCCGNEATSRLIGAEVLSRFRVTFDYPHARLILSSPSPRR